VLDGGEHGANPGQVGISAMLVWFPSLGASFAAARGAVFPQLGHSAVASSYGAAGALIIVLLWIYYSAQIFLLGAEFTKIYASRRGTPAAFRTVA
jgi:membrane protein